MENIMKDRKSYFGIECVSIVQYVKIEGKWLFISEPCIWQSSLPSYLLCYEYLWCLGLLLPPFLLPIILSSPPDGPSAKIWNKTTILCDLSSWSCRGGYLFEILSLLPESNLYVGETLRSMLPLVSLFPNISAVICIRNGSFIRGKKRTDMLWLSWNLWGWNCVASAYWTWHSHFGFSH